MPQVLFQLLIYTCSTFYFKELVALSSFEGLGSEQKSEAIIIMDYEHAYQRINSDYV